MAIDLFLRDGYAQTTIDSIAAAGGISRTTFFRYFDSKAEIVWAEFDAHTARLRARLNEDQGFAPSLDAVRTAVIEALRADLDDAGLSMRRFRLLDSSSDLRSQESEHWLSWAESIAQFVAHRHHLDEHAAIPSAVGGAMQATMLATLRAWVGRHVDPPGILADLDLALKPICQALQSLLDT